MTALEQELLEACQVALMNVEANTNSHELQMTKFKLRRAIKSAGGEEWTSPYKAMLKTMAFVNTAIEGAFSTTEVRDE